MKKLFPSIIMFAAGAMLLAGCKSEEKAVSYESVYQEKPVIIYCAPTFDNCERRSEKYPTDVVYNNEINSANKFFYETMSSPLIKHGYYVIGPVASEQIAASETRTQKQLFYGDVKNYSTLYGIDAVIFTTIHRWREENGKWIVYIEYLMRSTKTNTDMMHKWVKAVKAVPLNLKKDPVIMKEDKEYAEAMEFDNGTAQRCYLVEKVNDYILRNIPISSTRRQFESDMHKPANNTYIQYTWTEQGNADVQNITLEEFEQEAFLGND